MNESPGHENENEAGTQLACSEMLQEVPTEDSVTPITMSKDMAEELRSNGSAAPATNGTSEAVKPFSWLEPHYLFVILLVGEGEIPYGIQKDFLCAKSSFYREYFTNLGDEAEKVENVVKLKETPREVFSLAQNFMYTGRVVPEDVGELPSYEVLIAVWKLGHELGIEGLCDATLEAMTENRRLTQHIPATPLLVQVWQDTPDGSSIRKLLLSWAAEFMRSSETREVFAHSLPQNILSELVIAMSSLGGQSGLPIRGAAPQMGIGSNKRTASQVLQFIDLEDASGTAEPESPPSKRRRSDVLPNGTAAGTAPLFKAANRKSVRASLPNPPAKLTKRRAAQLASEASITTEQKLNFCSDLLTRMLSGPGFWTRLVGPFKDPVNPVQDGVPDYLERVKQPMDLGTMKAKMDRGEYADEDAFLIDMNQIFDNCYTYWTKKDPMWGACERLQKTFEEKYGQMNKWIAKMAGDESL